MAITNTTESPPSSSPRKRSWRRYSLRALFVGVLAAAIYCGWVAYRIREFHDQAAFIANLRSRGFSIETEPVVHEWFWRPLVGDDALQVKTARLVGDLPGNRLFGPSREDFQGIAAWKEIKWLQLYGAHVTDESLGVVSNFRHLGTLMLYQTAISDGAMRHLEALTKLTHLHIGDHLPNHDRAYGTLTGKFVQHIRHLKSLQTIDLIIMVSQWMKTPCERYAAIFRSSGTWT